MIPDNSQQKTFNGSEFERFRTAAQHLVPCLGDQDNVLMADTADSRNIKTRFDREDLSGLELPGAEPRGLVQVEPESVTSAVEESGPATGDAFGRVAVVAEKLRYLPVNCAAISPGAERSERQSLAEQADLLAHHRI
jgi:hypothetical protein